MKALTKIDVVAATFRNAIFDASTLNIMDAEDRKYETFDAQVLEACYRKLDDMPEEKISLYATAISYGFEINYERDSEEFIVLVQ